MCLVYMRDRRGDLSGAEKGRGRLIKDKVQEVHGPDEEGLIVYHGDLEPQVDSLATCHPHSPCKGEN